MTRNLSGEKESFPHKTRTDQDRFMIIFGIVLLILFITITYFSLNSETSGSVPRPKGPVKNPGKTSGTFTPYANTYKIGCDGNCRMTRKILKHVAVIS